MAAEILKHPESVRPLKSLVVRGGLARTFGSLASFLALSFLGAGIYILADAFANPVDAQAVALIVAAFVIALASIILFYLFKPRSSRGSGRVRRRTRRRSHLQLPARTLEHIAIENGPAQMELPYQRAYVDRTRVQL